MTENDARRISESTFSCSEESSVDGISLNDFYKNDDESSVSEDGISLDDAYKKYEDETQQTSNQNEQSQPYNPTNFKVQDQDQNVKIKLARCPCPINISFGTEINVNQASGMETTSTYNFNCCAVDNSKKFAFFLVIGLLIIIVVLLIRYLA